MHRWLWIRYSRRERTAFEMSPIPSNITNIRMMLDVISFIWFICKKLIVWLRTIYQMVITSANTWNIKITSNENILIKTKCIYQKFYMDQKYLLTFYRQTLYFTIILLNYFSMSSKNVIIDFSQELNFMESNKFFERWCFGYAH